MISVRLRTHAFALRCAAGRFLGHILAKLVDGRPCRIIYRGDDRTSPYLSRWHFIGGPSMPDGSSPVDEWGNLLPGARFDDERFVGLYVHRFHRSDHDAELHSHPWHWALSLIVAGGYREERRHGDEVVSRDVFPLSLNFIRANDFHRVDLLEEDSWSIFLVGPKAGSWGFWSRTTGEFWPWREFIAMKREAMS